MGGRLTLTRTVGRLKSQSVISNKMNVRNLWIEKSDEREISDLARYFNARDSNS